MTDILCAYCRGINVRQPDGTTQTEIRHGEIRYAHRCDCACHADQITTTMTVKMRVDVVIDVQEALLRFAEDRQLVQDDLDMPDRWHMVQDDFLTWLSEESEIEADVSGAGIVHYVSDVEEIDIADEDINVNGLLRLVIPKLPIDGDAPPRPEDLGMEPLFGKDELA